MKSLAGTFVFVLISAISFAQSPQDEGDGYLLDSVYKYNKGWYNIEVVAKYYYYYNLQNQIKLKNIYRNKNSFPDPADWYWTNKENFYYDDQHRLVSDIFKIRDFDETDWTNDEKYEYEYNDIMHSKASAFWDLTINSWVNGMKEIDSIKPPEDMEESFLWQFWNDDSVNWENELWYDTLYNESGLIDSIVYTNYHWDGSTSVDYDIYDYSYYPDTLFIYKQESNGNISFHKIFYTDDSLMKYDYLYFILEDSSCVTYFRDTDAYNENYWLVQHTEARWLDEYQQWFIEYKDSTIYNELGLVTQYDVCDLGQHERTKFQYNDENLLKRKIYYHDVDDTTLYKRWDYFYTYTYVNVPPRTSAATGQLVIYPNPAPENIRFAGFYSETQPVTYYIYDITGHIVLSGKTVLDVNCISITRLVPGNYFIKIVAKGKSWSGSFLKY